MEGLEIILLCTHVKQTLLVEILQLQAFQGLEVNVQLRSRGVQFLFCSH